MDMITAGNASMDGNPSTAPAQQWSKLPYDILGRIYPRLDALVERVRFAAVCTAWRTATTHPHRRVLPWLILDPCGGGDDMYCPQDRVVVPCFPLLQEAAGISFVGGHEGGWIASSQAPIRIINLFSGAEVALAGDHIINTPQQTIINTLQQTRYTFVLRKVVFSEQPTSSGCIIAAITDKHDFAFYNIGCPASGWAIRGFYGGDGLADIAFCNGELYGITTFTRQLIKYEFGVDRHGAPVLVNTHWLCMLGNYWESPNEHARYIVELHGKLLMVGSNHNWWARCLRNVCGSRLTVHELVDTNIEMGARNPIKYKWVEVNSLGEYALFLGPTCSKAVRVPARGCGDVRRNHIYFSHHRCLIRHKDIIPGGAEVFLTRSNYEDREYYKVVESDNGGVEGIMSVGYYVMGGVRPPMWLFPSDI